MAWKLKSKKYAWNFVIWCENKGFLSVYLFSSILSNSKNFHISVQKGAIPWEGPEQVTKIGIFIAHLDVRKDGKICCPQLEYGQKNG